MITIEYCKEGEAVSDFNYHEWLSYFITDLLPLCENEPIGKTTLKVSTSLPIHAIRLEIAKGNIDCSKVQFKFRDTIFHCNKYGRMNDWPTGFCDVETMVSENILRYALRRWKEDKS